MQRLSKPGLVKRQSIVEYSTGKRKMDDLAVAEENFMCYYI